MVIIKRGETKAQEFILLFASASGLIPTSIGVSA